MAVPSDEAASSSAVALRGIAKPPRFVPTNTHSETMMGSVAYGVSGDTSDVDVYGFCIPPKDELFPHIEAGEGGGDGQEDQGTPNAAAERPQDHEQRGHAPGNEGGRSWLSRWPRARSRTRWSWSQKAPVVRHSYPH